MKMYIVQDDNLLVFFLYKCICFLKLQFVDVKLLNFFSKSACVCLFAGVS